LFGRPDRAIHLSRPLFQAIHGQEVILDGDAEQTLVFFKVRGVMDLAHPLKPPFSTGYGFFLDTHFSIRNES
jgi:hypothetical protein